MKLFVSVSAAKAFESYDFAKFDGLRTLTLKSGTTDVKLRPTDVFGYRDGRNCVYLVIAEFGLTREFKVSEEEFDKRVGPKANAVSIVKAKKLFLPKVEKKTVSPKRTVKVETRKVVPKKSILGSQAREEDNLLKLVGDPAKFASIKTRAEALIYMREVWHRVNKLKCDGAMQVPNFRLLKDMGTKFQLRGSWSSRTRTIGAAPRLFKAREEIALTTIVHEIAHQAVTEIDKVFDRTKQGHGHNWETWMRKFGLTPSRYSEFDNTNYMSAAEKERHETAIENKKKAVENQQFPSITPSNLRPAQFFKPDENRWIKGIIMCPNDQAGKRWAFTNDQHTRSYRAVPSAWFHDVSQDDKLALTEKLMDHATSLMNGIAQYKEHKKEIRSRRKQLRNTYGWTS